VRLEPVNHPDDPRIEPYRAVRERDLTGRAGLFVVEGRVVLEKALRACPERLVSALISDRKLPGLSDLLAAWPEAAPVYVATPEVMDAVVGFPIHRGVLAVGRRAEASATALLAALPPQALVVGLSGIANHDNMGGLFRNAAAFGSDAVLLDAGCCDPLYRKAIRVSVGAALTVPFARVGPADELAARLADAGLEVLALTPRGESRLAQITPGPRMAVLFGAEGPGLPEAVLQRSRTVRIDMAGDFDSLNVATTSGIVLHQLASARMSGGPPRRV